MEGIVSRNIDGISEVDLVIPALRLASQNADGKISTSSLIKELTAIFKPDGKDAEIIPGRKDTYFSQKVRNLISHREGDDSFIANGYADHYSDGARNGGIMLTEAGRKLVKSLGG